MEVRISEREVSKLITIPKFENLFPPLSEKEYAALKEDIAERGIQVPLDITAENVVLCGMNRLRIAQELGLSTVPVRVVEIPDFDEQEIHARKDNLLRRQLSAEQASLQRAAIIQAKERKRGEHLKEYPRDEKGHVTKQDPICSTFEQIGRDVWEETARELGVSKATLSNDVKYADAVDEYPELKTLPKMKAISTARNLDALPPEEKPGVIEAIKGKGRPAPEPQMTPEEQERLQQLRRAQNFKTNVDRLISQLFSLSKRPVSFYFQGLDEIEWAFNSTEVFGQNDLARIDQSIEWLKSFRDEFSKQFVSKPQGIQGIRRVK